jgi:hypothetical protein
MAYLPVAVEVLVVVAAQEEELHMVNLEPQLQAYPD